MAKKKQVEMSSEQKAQAIGLVVLIAVLIIGVVILSTLLSGGNNTNSTNTEQTIQGNPSKWTKDDIEYKLASIEKGGLVEYTDKRIDDYAAILDIAELKCNENRQNISDLAVKGTKLLNTDDIPTTPYELIQATVGAIPNDYGEPMDCSELMTYVVARMGEN